eukprot:8693564-Pyramimonas_sp.AAC.1
MDRLTMAGVASGRAKTEGLFRKEAAVLAEVEAKAAAAEATAAASKRKAEAETYKFALADAIARLAKYQAEAKSVKQEEAAVEAAVKAKTERDQKAAATKLEAKRAELERLHEEVVAAQEAAEREAAEKEAEMSAEVAAADAALEAALSEWIEAVDNLGVKETALASCDARLAEGRADIFAKVAGRDALQAAALAMVEAARGSKGEAVVAWAREVERASLDVSSLIRQPEVERAALIVGAVSNTSNDNNNGNYLFPV